MSHICDISNDDYVRLSKRHYRFACNQQQTPEISLWSIKDIWDGMWLLRHYTQTMFNQ